MMRKGKLYLLVAVTAVFVVAYGIFLGCTPSERKDCVVMIGDSIFALTGAEPRALMDLAGQNFRTYYQSGAELSGGNIIAARDILGQYDAAQRAGTIRTLIMDGGGNDYLIGGGFNVEEELRQAWTKLLDKARDDGVENIIVQGYYRTCTSTAQQLEGQKDLLPQLVSGAASRGIRLFVYNPDDDPWFTSKVPTAYTITDCIHPSAGASQHMAQKLWDIMVQNNIEQGQACPASNGCN